MVSCTSAETIDLDLAVHIRHYRHIGLRPERFRNKLDLINTFMDVGEHEVASPCACQSKYLETIPNVACGKVVILFFTHM